MSSPRAFESALERVRLSFGLCVYGYVVMPEHVHLLIREPQRGTLADALKSLKQGVSRRLIALCFVALRLRLHAGLRQSGRDFLFI